MPISSKVVKKPQDKTNQNKNSLMNVVDMPVEELKRYPGNPRRNAHAVPHIVQSLNQFGWQQPIVCDVNRVIIVGDTRYQAALSRGDTHVPVHIATNLSEAQVAAYRLADNRVGEISEWDDTKLYNEIQLIEGLDPEGTIDLRGMGFTDEELGLFEMKNRVDERMLQDFNLMPIPKPKWILIAAPEDECAVIMQTVHTLTHQKKLKNTLMEFSGEPKDSRYGKEDKTP